MELELELELEQRFSSLFAQSSVLHSAPLPQELPFDRPSARFPHDSQASSSPVEVSLVSWFQTPAQLRVLPGSLPIMQPPVASAH
jgi:hypothetical protein